ncbi:hypothetical protein RBH20_07515 [Haloarcula sp. H-GB4]|uniref:hypothetical protein n=1 Tax=Haloarcula sp. H-GB4 TaxID=3069755 RepID=UPI0027B627E7|nr:hypothetical protein [Haloarcula sp. H-GB4]MDQ2072378.1 hypothetical protein [Haloarcula sp. H-GB4]
MHAAGQSPHVSFVLPDDTTEATAIAEFRLDYDLDRRHRLHHAIIKDGDPYETVATINLRTDKG